MITHSCPQPWSWGGGSCWSRQLLPKGIQRRCPEINRISTFSKDNRKSPPPTRVANITTFHLIAFSLNSLQWILFSYLIPDDGQQLALDSRVESHFTWLVSRGFAKQYFQENSTRSADYSNLDSACCFGNECDSIFFFRHPWIPNNKCKQKL